QLEKWKKIGTRIGAIFAFILLLIIIALPVFQWLIDYIWMDTLGFANVYTTMLTSKIILGISGFLLFSITFYFTLFWVRRSYLSHFDTHQLPPVVLNRKTSTLIMLGVAILSGLFGSLIVQSIGWEP